MFMCEILHLFPFSPLSSMAKMAFLDCLIRQSRNIFAYSDGVAFKIIENKKKVQPN